MTYKTFKEVHYDLWDWISKNPLERKENWPKWERINTSTEEGFINNYPMRYYCPLCEYVHLFLNDKCSNCPLTDKFPPCINKNSLYQQWKTAQRNNDSNTASKIAIIIRNSWK